MKESRNEPELRHIWLEWHNKCGNAVRKPYEQFIVLSNKAARLNSEPYFTYFKLIIRVKS